jgi:geranyl-CoA carboxylase beta subunit
MSSVFQSEFEVLGAEFKSNSEAMIESLGKVREVAQKQAATEREHMPVARKKGKLLPRERLALLLDPGSPFVEIGSIAGFGMYDDSDGSFSGGSLIAGIGYVSGRRVIAVVWNFAIKGGTINAVNVRKMLRIQEIAFNTRLPIVSCHESGGGNLSSTSQASDPWTPALFTDGGRIYCQQAELSARGIPQITVAHGNATAGGAYAVALSDYIILVRGQTQLFLAGPPLLKAGTGEDATAEELGGAEMHATQSGTGEYLAEDDADGIRIAREIVARLPVDPNVQRGPIEPPAYDPAELIGIYPSDRRKSIRMQEIIARIVDGSRFDEFEPEIDNATVCVHASLYGRRVGILSNNGPITPDGARKAGQFIQLCDQAYTPLIFLQNTTGFLVGTDVERRGQVKHSAKLIQAVANARMPKLTILVGNAYGAGNYAMSSRALKPQFVFAWPSARQALMGGAQAAKVMRIVNEGKWARMGVTPTADQIASQDQMGQMIEFGLDMISEAMSCSARLMDDGIIDPRDTRSVLGFLLDTVMEARERTPMTTSHGIQRL